MSDCKICDKLVARKYRKGGPVETTMMKGMDKSELERYHAMHDNDKLSYSNGYLKSLKEKDAEGLLKQELHLGGGVDHTHTLDEMAQENMKQAGVSVDVNAFNTDTKNIPTSPDTSGPDISGLAKNAGVVGQVVAAGMQFGNMIGAPIKAEAEKVDSMGAYVNREKAANTAEIGATFDPSKVMLSKDWTGKEKAQVAGSFLNNTMNPIRIAKNIENLVNGKQSKTSKVFDSHYDRLEKTNTAASMQGNLQNAQLEKEIRKAKGLKDGGVVKGAGTGTSDDVSMMADVKDFVVPASQMKNPVVKNMFKQLGLDKIAPKKSGTEKIFASNGEGLIPKEKRAEAEVILSEQGLSLNELAPNATGGKNRVTGGDGKYFFGADEQFEYDPKTQRTIVISEGKTKGWSIDNTGTVYNAEGKNISSKEYLKKAVFGKTGSTASEIANLKRIHEGKAKEFAKMNNGYDPNKSYDKQSEKVKALLENRKIEEEKNKKPTISEAKIKAEQESGSGEFTTDPITGQTRELTIKEVNDLTTKNTDTSPKLKESDKNPSKQDILRAEYAKQNFSDKEQAALLNSTNDIALSSEQQQQIVDKNGIANPVIRPEDKSGSAPPSKGYGFNAADVLALGQTALGAVGVMSQGNEPNYEISKDLLGAEKRATIAAQYGFTPAELSKVQGDILQNEVRMTEQSYKLAMSSAASAYGMELNNILTKNKAMLDLKIADDKLKLQKEGYADSFASRLANEHRFKYGEDERKYERDMNANAGLLNAGIANIFGNQKLKAENEFYKNLNPSIWANQTTTNLPQ